MKTLAGKTSTALFTFLLLFAFFAPCSIMMTQPEVKEKAHHSIQKISNSIFYFMMGSTFGSAYLLTRLGWKISHTPSIENEWLLLNHLIGSMQDHSYEQMYHLRSEDSLTSWNLNKELLSQIPVSSDQDRALVQFLEKHWLAKSTGFVPKIIDWFCPCFGVSVQINPENTNSYARLPSNHLSETYKNRMEAWKLLLPHPQNFPLILTRPGNVQEYLPNCVEITSLDEISSHCKNEKIILDCTLLCSHTSWETIQKACHQLNSDQLIPIQRVQQESIGGIRILGTNEDHYQFLLKWVSTFGLSANRVELDRWLLQTPYLPHRLRRAPATPFSKDDFFSYLDSYSQDALMLQGTIKVIRGLLDAVPENRWNEIASSPTQSSIVQLSFLRIQDELRQLSEKESFFEMASHLEQIHANLTALIEILKPFETHNFPRIYKTALTSIPQSLLPLTHCTLHASGMTSIAGIFKATQKMIGKKPHIVCGENTYFECIAAAEQYGDASSTEVDLILAQFNPPLRRTNQPATPYKVENIAETVHIYLKTPRTKPLTVAIDCTLDFINSPHMSELLHEFEQEIAAGTLNIICYRSGLKFDLFGMDNYCGAPFYMVHNHDPKWAPFDTLLNDPTLLTDSLSLNWFCLAYQNAASDLTYYQKQIFDNTRALLSKIPSHLFTSTTYQVVPFDPGVQPTFIDIKIHGPFHQIRGAALVGGCLAVKCMESGHPIFNRPSIGFYHPNYSVLFDEKCTTIRLTLGFDPAQVDVLATCFETLDALSTTPAELFQAKLYGEKEAHSPHLVLSKH